MGAAAVADAAGHRPHDLLWVDDASALIPVDAFPEWAMTPWLSVAPVVVRRAGVLRGDRIPVGLRGAMRSERCAAHVAANRVTRSVSPEDIARRVSNRAQVRASALPCLCALARIAPALDGMSLGWGVTGSVGFTLASGFDVLRPDSDLDLLVRAPRRGDIDALHAVAALVVDAASGIDVQVETPCGAFALKEWLRTGGPVLLKTTDGPVFCDDPWHADALDIARATAGAGA